MNDANLQPFISAAVMTFCSAVKKAQMFYFKKTQRLKTTQLSSRSLTVYEAIGKKSQWTDL